MRTTFSTIATAFVLMLSLNAFTVEASNPLKNYDSKKIISAYVDAAALGSADFNKFLFSHDFEYHNAVNNVSYGKRQYMAFLKANKGLRYDCVTEQEIMDECGKACVAKVTMTFKNFTRVDYVTLNRSEDGWKVSKVVTTYPMNG